MERKQQEKWLKGKEIFGVFSSKSITKHEDKRKISFLGLG